MTPPALTLVVPPAPWQRQPHESEDDHATFILWAFTTPRQPVPSMPPALRLVAINGGWEERAAHLDRRLADARPIETVTREIAVDAVQILSSELAAQAVRSRTRPGEMRPKDVIQLLQLVTALGGFSAAAPANAAAEYDYSALSTEELDEFMRLTEKARASALARRAG